MKKYDSYKDSCIDWIGEIPSHWKKCRLKNFLQLISTPSTRDLKIGLENIESGTGRLIDSDSEFDGNGIEFKEDDIIYGKLRPYLRKVWQAEFKGNAVGDFFIFRNKENAYPSYLKYLLLSDGFTKEVDGSTVGAKMPRVSSEFIMTLQYFLPPIFEQKEIADYLDKKCGEIDPAIVKVDKELELLDELKQSEISKAVTKGLNPNVSFKPSGIDWIGEIPSHWYVMPLKYVTDIIMGQSPNGSDIKDKGCQLFMQGNAEFGLIYPHPTLYCESCNKFSRIGDILMSVRAPVGELNLSDKIYGIGRGLCSIKATKLIPNYLWYFLIKSKSDFNIFSNGSTFEAITIDTLNNLVITFPPLSEQKEIADYLDRKCGEIDSLKEKLKQKKEKLQELRQSLISEVVTGKRYVGTSLCDV